MNIRALLVSTAYGVVSGVACLALAGAAPTYADSGHARIIRLSVVQGDVRVAREVKGDSLQTADWEAGELNMPIRQGYAVATDKGRAEVEFENGAMAFAGADTVIEFFDLSNADGAKTTRLVLRQGMKLTGIGAAIGLVLSLATSQLLSSLLVGVSARDPEVYIVVPLTLAAISLLACYIPARRAARIDPLLALRQD